MFGTKSASFREDKELKNDLTLGLAFLYSNANNGAFSAGRILLFQP